MGVWSRWGSAQATATLRAPTSLKRSDSLDRLSALSLQNIREALIRQEDTIIFSLIERAQVNHGPLS